MNQKKNMYKGKWDWFPLGHIPMELKKLAKFCNGVKSLPPEMMDSVTIYDALINALEDMVEEIKRIRKNTIEENKRRALAVSIKDGGYNDE